MCSFLDVSSGRVDMADIWEMNDLLDLHDYMESEMMQRERNGDVDSD